MRYIFYYRDKYDNFDLYVYREKLCTRNLPLEDLYNHLDDEQMRWIQVSDDDNDSNKVIIWSTDRLKESLSFGSFNTDEERLAYGKQYRKYGRKRFAEMPAIRITRENYESLKKQFEGLYKRNPQYLIMREHDNGYVDLLEKDELSEEDIANMNREHKIYQNYVKRLKEYEKAHPNRYPIWRSPEDNEFESDFALYDPVDEQGVD